MSSIIVLTGLMIKHTIADYFMQYSWMIKDKATYGAWGGVAHAKLHGLFTFIILLLYVNPLTAFLFGALDSIIHYHIDYVKSNAWKTKKLTSNDQMYWVIHGVDQFAHFLTYMLITYIYIICLL